MLQGNRRRPKRGIPRVSCSVITGQDKPYTRYIGYCRVRDWGVKHCPRLVALAVPASLERLSMGSVDVEEGSPACEVQPPDDIKSDYRRVPYNGVRCNSECTQDSQATRQASEHARRSRGAGCCRFVSERRGFYEEESESEGLLTSMCSSSVATIEEVHVRTRALSAQLHS